MVAEQAMDVEMKSADSPVTAVESEETKPDTDLLTIEGKLCV